MKFHRILSGLGRPFRSRYQALASKRDLDNLFAQMTAALEVRDYAGAGVGKLRGWAISPDALAEVLFELGGRDSPDVIEFGSGTSTIAIAASLRRAGGGHLVSIEHDPVFAESVAKRVRVAGLESLVELRVTETSGVEYPGGYSFKSYEIEDCFESFDVALVDGPIKGVHGELCRLGPLDWCMRHAREGSVVFLDDADRAGERTALDLIRARYPEAQVTDIPTEKGLARIAVNRR